MSCLKEIFPNFNLSDKALMYLLRRQIPNAQIENLYYVDSGIAELIGGTLSKTESQFFVVTNIYGNGKLRTADTFIESINNANFNAYWVCPFDILETTGTSPVMIEYHKFEFING